MHKASEIVGVQISLKVDSAHALFILLAADGSINRLGTGSINNTEKDMFIGKTDPSLFSALASCFTDDMLKFTGGYDVPEKLGVSCRMSMTLHFRDGSEDGFGFAYGSESKGVPREVAEIVIRAVELTQPWYEEQKKMAKAALEEPWWKFW